MIEDAIFKTMFVVMEQKRREFYWLIESRKYDERAKEGEKSDIVAHRD
jgi:hypothetical protein